MAEVEEEAPSKGGLIKIILMVLVVLLIAVGSAMGALFFTGFFEEKEADAAEEATEKHGCSGRARLSASAEHGAARLDEGQRRGNEVEHLGNGRSGERNQDG